MLSTPIPKVSDTPPPDRTKRKAAKRASHFPVDARSTGGKSRSVTRWLVVDRGEARRDLRWRIVTATLP